MSNTSELKARLERLGPVRDVSRPSLTPEESVIVLLRRTGALDQPITVARRLFAAGLTLKEAHGAINKLAESGWTMCAVARRENLRQLGHELAAMNVQLRQRWSPVEGAADIAAMRSRHGLSQREYADLLGIDVRTLQNWEQGRNRPDPAALSLMRIFDRAPQAFEEALSEPVG
jgi:DNA-binding transcriptional regulator YiaG